MRLENKVAIVPGSSMGTAGTVGESLVGSRNGLRPGEQVFAVVAEFGNRFTDVIEGPVSAGLLRGGGGHFGMPASGQFLDGGHVDGPVVEVGIDLGKAGGQEPSVGADRVPAERDDARLGDVAPQEFKCGLSGLAEADCGSGDGL